MTNLIQRLGMVTGLGLAAVALEGCETRLKETRSYLPQSGPEGFCLEESPKTIFMRRKNYVHVSYVMGIAVGSEPAYSIEETFSCNWVQPAYSTTRCYPKVGKRIISANGTVIKETKPGDSL